MNTFDFLTLYQKLQNNVIYDEINRDLDFASITYSKNNLSEYDNYALISRLPTEPELSAIEKLFRRYERKPVLYFPADMFSLDEKNFLEKHYHKSFEDVWMFYEDRVNKDKQNRTKRVFNEKDLDTFIQIFDRSYQKNDPQNPYGEAKTWIPVLKRAWQKFGTSDRLQYFITYKENYPVATSILNSLDGLGYISGVGALREVRGQGFGKLTTLHAVYVSQQMGNKQHVLATEERTYPNEFYKRIGFVTKFKALGYSRTSH